MGRAQRDGQEWNTCTTRHVFSATLPSTLSRQPPNDSSESSYIHTHPLTPSTEPLILPTVTSNLLAKQPAPSHSQTHRIYWPSAFRRPSFWLECVFRARTKFLCSAHNYQLLPALDLCSAVFVGNGARDRDGARCNGEGVTQRADAGSVAGRWGPMPSYTRGHHFSGRNLNMS